MDVLRLKGTPRQVGRDYGEAYREGFHELHARAQEAASSRPHWYGELELIGGAAQAYFPRFWDELCGAAEGAGLTCEEILLNRRLVLAAEAACTNVAFLDTARGPIFGKNLDLFPNPPGKIIVRHVIYENGQEIVHTVPVGDIVGRDTAMGGAGLTVGGSSVGTAFQQSLRHPPLDVALYAMACSCETIEEAIRFIWRYPYVAKGYNYIVVDQKGRGAVLECACPLIQIRWPEPGQDVIFCANTYKLTALEHADRRRPEERANSEQRYHYLERKLLEERVPRTFDQMQALLSSHGDDGGLCGPVCPGDFLETRLSVITLPAERQFWLADGRPCAVAYERVL